MNTTVCADTVDELLAIAERVADLGAVLWSVFFLVPVGRGRVLDPVSPTRAERVMSWLCDVRERAPFGVKTTEAPFYRRVALQGGAGDPGTAAPARDGVGRRSGIVAGDGFAFVSHVGDVYPSGFLPVAAGNVREDSLVSVYRDSELFESLQDRDALRGKCGACQLPTTDVVGLFPVLGNRPTLSEAETLIATSDRRWYSRFNSQWPEPCFQGRLTFGPPRLTRLARRGSCRTH